MSEDDQKMKNFFIEMTDAAKVLKKHLNIRSEPMHIGDELESQMRDIQTSSQLLWQSLFEFVQHVTCSTHPEPSKIKWIGFADEVIDKTFQVSRWTAGKAYQETMESLTHMATVDPSCRPESYTE